MFVTALILALASAFGSELAYAANLDEACGGPTAITCNSALWCQKSAPAQCTVAEAPGTCTKAPAFCIRISRPVCGCNGKTYVNDCERQRLKVQLDHTGACTKQPSPDQPAPSTAKPKKRKSGGKT